MDFTSFIFLFLFYAHAHRSAALRECLFQCVNEHSCENTANHWRRRGRAIARARSQCFNSSFVFISVSFHCVCICSFCQTAFSRIMFRAFHAFICIYIPFIQLGIYIYHSYKYLYLYIVVSNAFGLILSQFPFLKFCSVIAGTSAASKIHLQR